MISHKIKCVVSIAFLIGINNNLKATTAQFLLESLTNRSQILHNSAFSSELKPRVLPGGETVFDSPFANQADVLGDFPWREDIMTTVFWIGEKPTKNNPVPNDKSAWDTKWMQNFGGYDCPTQRIGFRPSGFIPQQNPFYIALPYNDISRGGMKPEASKVIPWYSQKYKNKWKSVTKGQWIAIHYKGKICYAQWEDVGPYRTDHWEYVFGNQRPSPNRNKAAGLDVSPSVRDYLGLEGNDYTDWKFVDQTEVPSGPWTKYGQDNPLSPYSELNQNQQARN